MLSLDENPPIVPGNIDSLRQLKGPWWVGHTKSRFEKAFAWELHEQGIGYFLPLSVQTTFSGGRKRKGMAPLFPSYVFFCGDEHVRWQALRTNRLCQVIPVRDQAMLLDELDQIHRVLGSGESLSLYPSLPIGTRCRVTAGPLKDVTGIVVERGASARMVLKVSMLGQGTTLLIDANLLQPEILDHVGMN